MTFSSVSDKELLSRTKVLVQRERELLTEVLHHLREIQRRRLYADLKLPSLFEYCTKVLKYSESQAQRRIAAMRIMTELPQIETKVASGELSLSNIAGAKTFFNQEAKSAPLSTQEKLEVLSGLENKSAREGKKILLAKMTLPPEPVKEKIRQVTAEITEIKFGADEKLLAKIKRLKGLLAHKSGNISMAELMDELCEIALQKLVPEKRKSLPSFIPPTSKVSTGRKYISVKTKSEIWGKAEANCENCQSQFALEIDHHRPVSLGGSNDPENLRLLCRNCNQRAAISQLGLKKMTRYLQV